MMLEGVIASSPGNEDLLVLGTRMNAQYALAFVEAEGDETFARSLYGKALDYGLRALDDEELNEALKGNAAGVAAALEEYDEDDVPLLFWTGLAYGSWINVNRDSVRAIADLPNAVAFMDRVIELDPTYFHGGAYLFKGQYHGRGGREIGGDPDLARESLMKAIEISEGRFLLAKVYLARFYAVPTQNQELYDELLFEVLEAPDDVLPGESLATAVAKHQAERLLLEAEDYFLAGS